MTDRTGRERRTRQDLNSSHIIRLMDERPVYERHGLFESIQGTVVEARTLRTVLIPVSVVERLPGDGLRSQGVYRRLEES